jgi:glycosyltransferase involved in cell wall biosynthesis
MKILMVINCLNRGGRERRMLELIKHLTKNKGEYDICLISLLDLVEYEYVYDLPIRFEIIEKKSDKDFSLVFKLRKVLKEFNPDIIHSWDVMGSCYMLAANFMINKPMINGVIYDAATTSNLYERHYGKIKLTTALSKVTVANSEAGMKAYKATPPKTIRIYNGVDFNRFSNLKRTAAQVEQEIFGGPKGDRFIGAMVAAFDVRKDYDTFLKAAVKLCAIDKRITFLMVGSGSGLEEAKAKVPAELIGKQLYFLGKCDDVESILQIIDIGMLITPCEGISNAIIEYMSSGKPVIASIGGGTEELVIDGKNGFLVEQKNPEMIVEKFELLRNNPELVATLGANAKQWVHQNFSVQGMTEAYIDLYNKLKPVKKKVELIPQS